MADEERAPMTQQPVRGEERNGVFVSYARADGEEFAARLRLRLEAEGLPFVWQDRERMYGGHDWWLQIEGALKRVAFLILVITPSAVRSKTVRREWRYGLREGVCVFGVKGTPDAPLGELPAWMNARHIYDLGTLEDGARAPEWEKFLADLRGPCKQPRVPFMAGDLPVDYVRRGDELERLKQSLLDPEREETAAVTLALSGAGGFGKTTLAQALCDDDDVQTFFHGGVLWTTLGERPGDLTPLVGDLITTLSGEPHGFARQDAAVARLRELLAERTLLFVIDDVWDAEHLKPFTQGGPRCARLITTRVLDALPARVTKINVDAMRPEEAVRLLRFDLPEGGDAEFAELSAALGEWPLLLKLVNGALRYRVADVQEPLADALAFVREDLKENGLVAFDVQNTEARDKAVEATLRASLRHLNEGEDARFRELAVFPEDADVPLAALERLWGLSRVNTDKLCGLLHRLSLLQTFDLKERRVRLHDVIRKYLVHQHHGAGQLAALHARLLAAYRPPPAAGAQVSPADWTILPAREPYVWDQLAYHLVEAGRADELHELLSSTNAEGRNAWYAAKAAVRGNAGYLADLNEAWRLAAEESREQLGRSEAAPAVAREVRYGLIKSSLSSLARNLPTGLLVAAAARRVLTPEEVLSYARAMPHGNKPQRFQKNQALVLLSEVCDADMRDALLRVALDTVRYAEDEGDRADLAGRLAVHMPESFVGELLKLAEQFDEPEHREQVVAACAARYGALGRGDESLALLERVTDDAQLSGALYYGGARLDLPHLRRALALADKLSPARREEVHSVLLPRLAALGDAAGAVAASALIQHEYSRAKALAGMAESLAGDDLERAISLARAVGDYGNQVYALGHLGQSLPEPRRTEFFTALCDETFPRYDRQGEHAREHLISSLPYELISTHSYFKKFYAGFGAPEVAKLVAARLAKLGKVAEALSLIKKNLRKTNRTEALRHVVPLVTEEHFGEMEEILSDGADREGVLVDYLPRIAELGRAREALTRALALESELYRSNAVAGVAAHLDADGVRLALRSFQLIGDDAAHGEAFMQLAAYVPGEEALDETLEYLESDEIDESVKHHALSEIGKRQPQARVELLFSMVADELDGDARTKSLLALAPHLSTQTLVAFSWEAYIFQPETRDAVWYVGALAAMLPKLEGEWKETVRRKAAAVAWEVIRWDEGSVDTELLTRLAPSLLELGEAEALAAAAREAAADDERLSLDSRMTRLARAAGLLEGREREEINEKVLAEARANDNPYEVVVNLGHAADVLTEPLLREAFRTVREKCETQYIGGEVADFAARLAALEHAEDALELARLVPQDRRPELASALSAVAVASRAPPREALLVEAFEVASRIQNPVGGEEHIDDRARTLRELAPRLIELERHALYETWERALPRLALNTRAEFLADLGALAPVLAHLGGVQAIAEVSEAVRDAGRWWP